MNVKEVAEVVSSRLTGGGEICLDVEMTQVEKFVRDAFREVRPWFDEPPVLKTLSVIPVTSSGGSVGTGGWIDLETVSPPVKYIRKVYPTKNSQCHVGDVVRDLLLLPASPLETESIEENAAWQMSYPMVQDLFGKVLSHRHDKTAKKLWLDDVDGDAITLEYIPDVDDVEQITVIRALQWVINMTEARTKMAVAMVRGKFTLPNLQTDASELRSEASTMIDKLMEDLKDLSFSLASRLR